MSYLINIYFISTAFGLIAFQITKRLLPGFPMQGWGVSRGLGLFLFGWLAWITQYLFLIEMSELNYFVTIIYFVAGLILVAEFLNIKKISKTLITNELIFLTIMLGWSILRTYNPDLNTTEKFMDYGIINSILSHNQLPPKDLFLGDTVLNYYYFGQYLSAFLLSIEEIPLVYGYSLYMSFIFALLSTHIFSISLFLLCNQHKYLISFFCIFLVCISGNAHWIYELFNDKNYYFPGATRFIENSIHEFPIYSFLVNDLHAHVLSLITNTVLITLLLGLFCKLKNGFWNPKKVKILDVVYFPNSLSDWILFILIGLYIGGTYSTNAWDLPIYFVLFLICFFYGNYKNQKSKILINLPLIKKSIFGIGLVILCALLFWMPYWTSFIPISKTIAWVPIAKRTPPFELLVVWGTHIPLFFLFLYIVRKSKKKLPPLMTLSGLFVSYALFLIIIPEIIYVKDIHTTHFRANTMFKLYYQAWVLLGIGFCIFIQKGLLHSAPWFSRFVLITSLGIGGSYSVVSIYQHFGNFKFKSNSISGLKWMNQNFPDDVKIISWLLKNGDKSKILLEAWGESYSYAGRISIFSGIPSLVNWPNHEWLWRGSRDKDLSSWKISQTKSLSQNSKIKARGGRRIPHMSTTKQHRDWSFGIGSKAMDTVNQRLSDTDQIFRSAESSLRMDLIEKYNIKYLIIGPLERKRFPNVNIEHLKLVAKNFIKISFESYIFEF